MRKVGHMGTNCPISANRGSNFEILLLVLITSVCSLVYKIMHLRGSSAIWREQKRLVVEKARLEERVCQLQNEIKALAASTEDEDSGGTDEAVADVGSGTGMDSDRKCEMALQVLRSASVHETAGKVQHSTGVAGSGMRRAADMEPVDSALMMLHSMLCSEPCVSPSARADGIYVDRQA